MAAEQLLRSVMRAVENANFDPLYSAISDDVVWKSAATMRGMFPFGGQYRGRQGVETLISEIEADYTVRSLTPREVISKGDVLWGLFWVDLLYKPTLAQVCFDFAIRWRLLEGKVIEHQGFVDTAAMLVCEQSGLLPR